MKRKLKVGDIITNKEEIQDIMFDILREVNDFVCNYSDMTTDKKIERFEYFAHLFDFSKLVLMETKEEGLDDHDGMKSKVIDMVGDRPVMQVMIDDNDHELNRDDK